MPVRAKLTGSDFGSFHVHLRGDSTNAEARLSQARTESLIVAVLCAALIDSGAIVFGMAFANLDSLSVNPFEPWFFRRVDLALVIALCFLFFAAIYGAKSAPLRE